MNEREVFSAAVAIRDPGHRAAFLDKECAGNGVLRRRVEALLNAHLAAESFLERPAVDDWSVGPSDSVPAAAVDPAATDSVSGEVGVYSGRWLTSILSPSSKPSSLGRLGHYEVESLLGHGGFGTVLRAFDERLHRTVAIKLLSPELAATSPPRKRFLREARAAAAIRHQNVVAIHAVEDSPLPHLVMEYVPGQTLQQIIDGHGPLEIDDVLRIAEQIAAGLAAAHARGLVHRDIKPSNVLLEGGLGGSVKISDFGLARAADDATLTQSGTVAGTPLYMSPEQAQGQTIDQRSDLFSLGSVLYVMVSGRPPFRAPTTVAVLKRVVEDAPRPIAEIIPEAPDWLCAIIAKLHAKSPDDRFQTAQVVGDLLKDCLASLRANRTVKLPAGIPPAPRASSALASTLPFALPEQTPAVPRRLVPPARRWTTVAAVLLATMAGLGLTEATGVTKLAATIIRLTIGSGTLVIETDDPGVSITVDGAELRIQGAGLQELTLKPGSYWVEATKDGQPVSQELVTITRGGREVVRVTLEGIAKGPQPSPPPSTPANGDDPDRRAAEWALSVGIPVEVSVPGDLLKIAPADALPQEPFQLLFADLRFSQVKDAGLSHFAGCQFLTSLLLNGPNVTDAGVANFRNCKQLKGINLEQTGVTDAGLMTFEGCRTVTHLLLTSPRLTDAGLAVFRNCPLRSLNLSLTQVTDRGLAQFDKIEVLAGLQLAYTSVTDDGLAHFRACALLDAIDLTDTAVTDVGLAHLRNCRRLQHVNLENTRIGDAGLSSLHECQDLAFLVLNGTRVTDAGLTELFGHKSLREVRLRRTEVTAAMVDKLRQALPECRVEWDGGEITPQAAADPDRAAAEWALSIGCPIEIAIGGSTRELRPGDPLPDGPLELHWIDFQGGPHDSEEGLAHLDGCRHLTHLNLSGSEVTDAGLAHIRHCTQLVKLALENTSVTAAGLASFTDCGKLETLILNNSPVTDVGLAPFDGCRELTQLQLSRTRVTDSGLVHLGNCPKLVEINLGYTVISNAGLAHFGTCPDLVHLNLIDTPVSDAGLENFRECDKLESLVVSNTRVTDAGLSNFRDCRRLTRLNLDNLGISDEGLANFQHCGELTELTLFGAKITDAGLAPFSKCTRLTYLLLDNTPLTDAGLQHFRGCQNLQRVHLDNTQVTDAGLAQFQGYEQMQQLTLMNTSVGDAGLRSLSGMRELNWINLSGTRMTDAGLIHLHTVAGLREVDLIGTQVTADGVNDLRQALPECRITWGGGIVEPRQSLKARD